MYRRTTRLNHVALVLLGLVLVAAGGFLLARHFGWLSTLPSSARIYSRREARWLHDHHWVWYAVAAGAIVIGLLALRWLLVQPRLDRVRTLRLDDDPAQRGYTRMGGDVLADAVEGDVEAVSGVARARVIVIGDADRPELVVRVTAQPGADLAAVHHRVVTDAVAAARSALDVDDLPVQIHLTVAGRRPVQRERT